MFAEIYQFLTEPAFHMPVVQAIFGIDDAIMLGAAALGTGLQLFGGEEEEDASQKQAQIAKKAAKKQNKIIKKKIIPLLKDQRELEQKAYEQSVKAEGLRKQQMELDATRARRQIIRDAVRARSMSLTIANAQGAAQGSGLFGALAQITAESNRQGLGVAQNLGIGRGIFAANLAQGAFLNKANKLRSKENIVRAKLGTVANTSNAQMQAAGVNSGSTFSNLGSTLVSQSQNIGSIGADLLFGSN
jgi:hypothetical protein